MDTHPGKVLAAFPSTGHDISTRFVRSLWELDSFDREHAVATWEAAGAPDSPTPVDLRLFHNFVAIESTTNLAKARNRLVEFFLDDYPECEWLWFVDTDMVFAPDLLHRLIARALQHDLRVLGGLCMISSDKGVIPTLFVDDRDTITRVMLDWPRDTLAEVAATGAACLLIHRSVLEKMRADAGGSVNAWFGFDVVLSDTGKEWALGEDVSFCRRARAAGFKVVVDCTAHVGHHKLNRVWWPDDSVKWGAPPPDEPKLTDTSVVDEGPV